ncbi:typeIV pilus assembly protein pilP [Sorangium cellulosum]|uniref:TypeIV pilus assembly protein pilP n=1 Tax=Sorangium cellulosum TaxID=56 RepID=A0A4P2Q6F5_SORCE|nr:pilus assembly protein PilP [Sorangium cellulosum]AUX25064.1 typeIV pilus assembly protein pilP [Sorangium cellulosum]
MSAGRKLLLALAATAALALAGCEDEPAVAPTKKPAGKAATAVTSSPPRAAAPGATGAAADAGAPEMPPLPLREFQEADFTESDRSRDPFRSFESLFATQARGRVTIQRQVLVDRFALDELKLVGVVSRAPARALLTDPTGLGWVVKVGDFVGKAEIVHSGGPTGVDVAVNWRVDRIRDSDVVFIREDPSHPEIPPTTRVIALRPLGEANEPAFGAP